ncbi:hypothetical protein BGY98DRAFT_1096167 [Russula aff. rugulosa BPL654]|nr:hypothetical protein BGY98DRAFT_1096167 [Russula aff. rugulosa BPL654]
MFSKAVFALYLAAITLAAPGGVVDVGGIDVVGNTIANGVGNGIGNGGVNGVADGIGNDIIHY